MPEKFSFIGSALMVNNRSAKSPTFTLSLYALLLLLLLPGLLLRLLLLLLSSARSRPSTNSR